MGMPIVTLYTTPGQRSATKHDAKQLHLHYIPQQPTASRNHPSKPSTSPTSLLSHPKHHPINRGVASLHRPKSRLSSCHNVVSNQLREAEHLVESHPVNQDRGLCTTSAPHTHPAEARPLFPDQGPLNSGKGGWTPWRPMELVVLVSKILYQ